MADMKKWIRGLAEAPRKKAMPVLSFPGAQKLNVPVSLLIRDSEAQARCMQAVAQSTDAAASVSLMDLSVEAEAFGSRIRFQEDEVPAVEGRIVETLEEAEALQVPPVGAARTGIYIDAIRKAKQLIQDRPVFAGVIGPYSLAGRLIDVTEIMYACFDDPDMVHAVLEKTTEFLIRYCLAYKEAGADGVVMAEPLAGLLNASMSEEFSCDYVKRIVDAVQSDDFIVIYHNCGNAVPRMMDEILSTGSAAYHFGNAINMLDVLPCVPADTPCMGNVDPAGQFSGGTPESIRAETLRIMEECCKYPNFVISSGCDIPPKAKWENIDAFFAAVEEYYSR